MLFGWGVGGFLGGVRVSQSMGVNRPRNSHLGATGDSLGFKLGEEGELQLFRVLFRPFCLKFPTGLSS